MELKTKNLGDTVMVVVYVQDSGIYLLIMVCNSCVHFLQKFRPIGLPKDDLFANMEGTKLRGILDSMNMCYTPTGCCSPRAVVYKLRPSPATGPTIQTRSGVKGKLRLLGNNE